MRGKPGLGHVARNGLRIIPARAGQTEPPATTYSTVTDHPRACGANDLLGEMRDLLCGSSPRVRGKHGLLCVRLRPIRIIPARAGQTRHQDSSLFTCSDHPRACGANMAATTSRRPRAGSSPRVRGKQPGDVIQLNPKRIIPARAGQTGSGEWGRRRAPDHPRACGANLLIVVVVEA